ncbi:MAG TPA: hypothetical protein VFA67_10755 [Candidatus Sulfotelmatobacter sp.]|nr:hypothetical protein [Candidatus Sulfotelmatobacter sp.]
MKLIPLFSLAALLIASTAAQDSAPVFYAESFRKTPIRITEDKFEVKLTADNPNYKQRLRDSSGTERFEFTIVPRRPEGGANGQITSWEMSLRDLRYPVYGNLLQFDRELSEDPKDNLYWLNPLPSAAVPALATRIIKIHGFYFLAQVTNFRVAPPTPYLEYMTVRVELANSDPRQQPR